MLDLFVLVFSIELGLIDTRMTLQDEQFQTPKEANYASFGTELQYKIPYGMLFIGGEIESQQYFNRLSRMTPAFTPFMAVYDASAGMRYKEFELAWTHFCKHPVRSLGIQDISVYESETRIYIKYKEGIK